MCVVCLAAAPSSAAEPSWWTEQKRSCGLPSGLAYNSWDGRCNKSGGRPASTPSYDYGAAERAQQAAAEAERQRKQAEAEQVERERLAEEKRKQDEADFIQKRDATANTLKGSSNPAMNQLKGLSGMDNSGLKGSGFDSDNTMLKGLRGSNPVVLDSGSQSKTPPAEKSSSAKSKEICPPSQDPSVVDLCFLGNRSTAIDPRILKGLNSAESAALTSSVQDMANNLLPFDKAEYQAIADLSTDPAKTGKQWPGPNNPGKRYLNPLIEPEKVKAYWDKVNAGLKTHAEAEAKIVTAAKKSIGWRELRVRQDADPKFRRSTEKIISNQDRAEGLARQKTVIKLREFLEKQGGADWANRIKNDKLFSARLVMERDALLKQMDQEIHTARARALKEMTVLVSGWKGK